MSDEIRSGDWNYVFSALGFQESRVSEYFLYWRKEVAGLQEKPTGSF
jgi:hypothetical protein